MKVVRLNIKNFRGIREATLHFDGHTLIVGPNNVGKSTVCEALELVLGVDRLKRFPPVEEFDFYNAQYLDKSQTPAQPIPIDIEVVLTELGDELSLLCVGQIESWHLKDHRLLGMGEAAMVDNAVVIECLRIVARAHYDPVEDEFQAKLLFCSGPTKEGGQLREVPRDIRQRFGFIYLRALRTGSRALSLERGSLLDIILQRSNIRTGIWESTIDRLRGLTPPIDEGTLNLAPILENIEERLANYVAMNGGGRATQLFVSQLTREHLRKTISFFLKVDPHQAPVPFQEVGTGTLSALVLSLLSFIAEMKNGSVIFAMEEPEIAVSPHTQRRIAQYLISTADQCFVTSHSPYIIEQFEPEQLRILRRGEGGTVSAKALRVGETVKSKTYRRHARRAFSEAILGRGVIVGEGITEKDIVLATAAKLEEMEPQAHYPLDLAGVSVISVDGEGSLAEFGEFFADLGIFTYALFDSKPLTAEMQVRVDKAYTYACQTKYKGAEQLLVEECPTRRLWELLVEVRDAGGKPTIQVPAVEPNAGDIKKLANSLLANNKGDGYAGRLIELCAVDELPPTVRALLEKVYAAFKRPPVATPVSGLTGIGPSTGSSEIGHGIPAHSEFPAAQPPPPWLATPPHDAAPLAPAVPAPPRGAAPPSSAGASPRPVPVPPWVATPPHDAAPPAPPVPAPPRGAAPPSSAGAPPRPLPVPPWVATPPHDAAPPAPPVPAPPRGAAPPSSAGAPPRPVPVPPWVATPPHDAAPPAPPVPAPPRAAAPPSSAGAPPRPVPVPPWVATPQHDAAPPAPPVPAPSQAGAPPPGAEIPAAPPPPPSETWSKKD